MPQIEAASEHDSVQRALDLLAPEASPQIERAWSRQLSLEASGHRSGTMVRLLTSIRSLAATRRAVSLPIAAVVVIALSLTASPVRGLAAQFLTIFRVQDFAPITLPANGGQALVPDLSKLGDMQPNPPPRLQTHPVASLAEASSAVGFTVSVPGHLPANVQAQPSRIAVSAGRTVGFTFRADKARAYLASIGRSDFALPAKFDGASLQVHVPAVAVVSFTPPGTAAPSLTGTAAEASQAARAALNSLIVVEARSPTVDASGVSLDELRSFLLSMPGLPPSTAGQLRAIGDWSTTLPVPVPPGVTARKTQVNGASGLAFNDDNGRIGGALMWQRNGIIYALAGSYAPQDLQAVAASLG